MMGESNPPTSRMKMSWVLPPSLGPLLPPDPVPSEGGFTLAHPAARLARNPRVAQDTKRRLVESMDSPLSWRVEGRELPGTRWPLAEDAERAPGRAGAPEGADRRWCPGGGERSRIEKSGRYLIQKLPKSVATYIQRHSELREGLWFGGS